MKRSWLIGAALVFSLTAVGCSDDDDDDSTTEETVGPDGGRDAGPSVDAGGGMDATVSDGGGDAGVTDGGDAGRDQ